MTSHGALFRVARAAMDDDQPRLALADWLEDNGHPRRAAAIRYWAWTVRPRFEAALADATTEVSPFAESADQLWPSMTQLWGRIAVVVLQRRIAARWPMRHRCRLRLAGPDCGRSEGAIHAATLWRAFGYDFNVAGDVRILNDYRRAVAEQVQFRDGRLTPWTLGHLAAAVALVNDTATAAAEATVAAMPTEPSRKVVRRDADLLFHALVQMSRDPPRTPAEVRYRPRR